MKKKKIDIIKSCLNNKGNKKKNESNKKGENIIANNVKKLMD